MLSLTSEIVIRGFTILSKEEKRPFKLIPTQIDPPTGCFENTVSVVYALRCRIICTGFVWRLSATIINNQLGSPVCVRLMHSGDHKISHVYKLISHTLQ